MAELFSLPILSTSLEQGSQNLLENIASVYVQTPNSKKLIGG